MVAIDGAETGESFWVVPNQLTSHFEGNGGLPGVVFAHALWGPTLEESDANGMSLMQALPTEAA